MATIGAGHRTGPDRSTGAAAYLVTTIRYPEPSSAASRSTLGYQLLVHLKRSCADPLASASPPTADMGPRNTRARFFYGRPIGLPGAAGMMRTLPYHPQRWALTLNTQRAAFLNPNFGQLQVKLRETERQ